jgi:hypothetical protein
MAHDVAPVMTAGIVALAFFLLVGFMVWRLTATVPRWMARMSRDSLTSLWADS